MTKLTLLMGILTGLLAAFSTSGSDTALQTSKHIRSILQDKTGNFWFGTDGDGACRYDGNSLTCFTEKEGLCSNFVRTSLEDKAGNIWFGTRDGVCRYDGKSFANLTDKEGQAYSGKVRQSEPENLWFGTRMKKA